MSPSTNTRVAALEVLTKVCELGSRQRPVCSPSAYAAVSEALSSTRLSLGEPARFHFLVSMMSSCSGAPDLTPAALRFVNAFLEASPGAQERVFAQAELQHAGFSPDTISAVMPQIGACAEEVRAELRRWGDGFVDVAALPERLLSAEREREALKEKVTLLERKVQILQEEKGVLKSLERCLKERCCHLEDEVNGLRVTEASSGPKCDRGGARSPGKGSSALLADGSVDTKHHASTPEDEGISSTDNPSSSCEEEEGEARREGRGGEEAERIMYETFAVQSETMLEGRVARSGLGEEEEETTIEEVIRELRDLVDDEEAARREAEASSRGSHRAPDGPPRLQRPSQQKKQRQQGEAARVQATWSEIGWPEEPEIVPSRILPQPPRRPRSLARRAAVKSAAASTPFFEDESSGQSSDSEEQRRHATPASPAVVASSGARQSRTVVTRAYGGLRRWETVVAGPSDSHKSKQPPRPQTNQPVFRYAKDYPCKALRRSESLHHGKIAAMPERWGKVAVEAVKTRPGSRRGSLDDGLFFVPSATTPTPRPTPPPPPLTDQQPTQLLFAARARKSRSLDRVDAEDASGGDWSLGWDFPRGRPPLSRSATRRAHPPPSLWRRGDAGGQRCPPEGASCGSPYAPLGYGQQGGIVARSEVARKEASRKPSRVNSKLYPPQTAAKVTDLLSGLY